VTGPVVGDDGLARCPWGDSPADYRAYHDREWGRPIHGDQAVFERLSLEGFQSGLSWLTILRRRDAFRRAFADFDPAELARWDGADVERLLQDPGIIRHRGKITAVIENARVLDSWQADEGEGALDALVWSYAETRAPAELADIPASTAASEDLARRLRRRGWRFIGPTTAYAALQAMGVVEDHLIGCHARPTPSRLTDSRGG
jgi:DNA-3-methyladenine glycosylase I